MAVSKRLTAAGSALALALLGGSAGIACEFHAMPGFDWANGIGSHDMTSAYGAQEVARKRGASDTRMQTRRPDGDGGGADQARAADQPALDEQSEAEIESRVRTQPRAFANAASRAAAEARVNWGDAGLTIAE